MHPLKERLCKVVYFSSLSRHIILGTVYDVLSVAMRLDAITAPLLRRQGLLDLDHLS